MKDVWEKEEKSNKASKEVRNEQMTVNQRCGWESSHFALSTYMSDSFKKKKKKVNTGTGCNMCNVLNSHQRQTCPTGQSRFSLVSTRIRKTLPYQVWIYVLFWSEDSCRWSHTKGKTVTVLQWSVSFISASRINRGLTSIPAFYVWPAVMTTALLPVTNLLSLPLSTTHYAQSSAQSWGSPLPSQHWSRTGYKTLP